MSVSRVVIPNKHHTIHFNMIIACDVYGTIGDGIRMPWVTLQGDLKRFKALTEGQVMIMGRKTFESLPSFPNGLPNRRTYVVGTKYTDAINDLFIKHQPNCGGFTDPNVIFVESIPHLRERLIRDILDGIEISTRWLAGGVDIWQTMDTAMVHDMPVTTGLGTNYPIRHTFRFEPIQEVHLSLVDTPQRGDVYYKGAITKLANALRVYGRDDWEVISQSEHDGGLWRASAYPGYTYYHLRHKAKEVK